MEVCLLTMPLFLAIILIVAFAAIGVFAGYTYRKKVAEHEISSAEEEATRIINESIKTAESKKREALVEAKEEIHAACSRRKSLSTARPMRSKRRTRRSIARSPLLKPSSRRSP